VQHRQHRRQRSWWFRLHCWPWLLLVLLLLGVLLWVAEEGQCWRQGGGWQLQPRPRPLQTRHGLTTHPIGTRGVTQGVTRQTKEVLQVMGLVWRAAGAQAGGAVQHSVRHCLHHHLLLLLLLGQGCCHAQPGTAVRGCTIPLLLLLWVTAGCGWVGGSSTRPKPCFCFQGASCTCHHPPLLLLLLLLGPAAGACCSCCTTLLLLLEVQLCFQLQQLLLGESPLLLSQAGPAVYQGLHAQGYGTPADPTPRHLRLGAAAAPSAAGAHTRGRTQSSGCSSSCLCCCRRAHLLLLLLLLLLLHAAAVDVRQQLVVHNALHIHHPQHVTR
jgi:hypothetical protein